MKTAFQDVMSFRLQSLVEFLNLHRRVASMRFQMSEPKIEFKWLDAKCTGTDTVIFRLEDGATVKVKIDIDRAGIATNVTNPDGTPHYEIGTSVKVAVVPPKKTYFIPKSQLKTVVSKDTQE